jgi:RimJ/RimL family protein N-acetyltransferase
MIDIKLDRKKIQLTEGKILLRPYRMSDVNALYQAVRESIKEVGLWLPFAHENYTTKESKDWIKKGLPDWKKGIGYYFAILNVKDGTFLGGCGLNEIDKVNRRANLGYWVRTSRMGQGVAPAATKLLAKWGFEVLKLQRIEIGVAVGNERSLRVAEKVGAKWEGILRNRINIRDKMHDAVMHSLIPGEVKE